MKDIIIIGGGLSGLTAGYFLKNKAFNVQILEASEKIGGRIKTTLTTIDAALEMGATWVFSDYHLKNLLSELGVGIYEQFNHGYGLYETSPNSKPQKFNAGQMTGGQNYHKIAGGSYQVINALANKIGFENITTNAIVQQIEDKETFIRITTSEGNFYDAKNVIITIPPRLLEASITFLPKLYEKANEIRKKTHTWMGDSIKFSVEYKTPFWRKNNLAGLAVSNVGLLREVQDHVNASNTAFALVGFLDLTEEQQSWTMEKRKEHVIKDMVRIFGEEGKDVLNYQDYIWRLDNNISVKGLVNNGLYAHENNGNREITKPEMNNKLFFAGAETSSENPGVMEGAVKSGKKAAEQILLLKQQLKAS